MANKKRNLDGIYLRIQRDGKWQAVCLSDMTKEELEINLDASRGEWLKGAVVHLVGVIQELGEMFDAERVTEETK